MDAELVALYMAAREANFLKTYYQSYLDTNSNPTISIHCDNQTALTKVEAKITIVDLPDIQSQGTGYLES